MTERRLKSDAAREARNAEVVRLYRLNTAPEIAAQLGMSLSGIKRVIRHSGISIGKGRRPVAEQPPHSIFDARNVDLDSSSVRDAATGSAALLAALHLHHGGRQA